MSQNPHSQGGPMNPHEIAGQYSKAEIPAEKTDFFDGLPGRIRVGPLWFKLIVSEPDVMSEQGPLGMTDRDNCEIVIRRTGNNSQDLNTTVHEVNHAIYFAQGLGGEEDEEPIVNRMTNGFLALMYDNPDYTSWLNWAVEEVAHG